MKEPTDPMEPNPDRSATPTLSETFAAAAKKAGIGQVTPGETPTAASLIRAIGGIRGLIESILPGLSFLVIFTFSGQLLPSVIAPLAVSLVFIALRAVKRSPVMPAIAGFIGVAISAILALTTGKAEDNFLPGLVINSISIVVLLASIIARWPLIGIIAGLLTGDATGWREDRAKFRIVTVATWCWVGLFTLRLGIQAPLYLTGQPELLASTKLIMGVPLYASMLWVTWLLVRSAFGHVRPNPRESA